ncbi:class F sortase [Candidatus Saccharibacteria bacterium]|nr:class F sortase [Candidatus Saccharibacteria bacterium]
MFTGGKFKIRRFKGYIPRILWGLLGLAAILFLLRVMIWEGNYYHDQEGSERASSNIVANDNVDETEVTEDDLNNYTVAPDRPRFLIIEKLNIKARVLEVGINNEGELATPRSIFDVGWYGLSAKPGEPGTMLIDGHNGGPTKVGVFKYTPSLKEGDIITIERGDGAIFNYSVVDNVTISLDDADAYMETAQQSPVEDATESLTLITCTGEWSQPRQTYLSRQFTRAVRTE